MKNNQDEAGFRMRDAPIKDFFVCENAGVVLQNVFWIFGIYLVVSMCAMR